MWTPERTESWEELLRDFRPWQPPPTTFFDAGQIARRETVITQFLRFFLDSSEAHGLGTLFADSLLAAVAATTGVAVGEGDHRAAFMDAEAEVHCPTAKKGGGFIDLVLVHDCGVLIVEHKIDHNMDDNDLVAYREHGAKVARKAELRRSDVLGIILAPDVSRHERVATAAGYISVGYKAFANQVLERMGPPDESADAKFAILATELVTTMKHLDDRSGEDQVRAFIQEHRDELFLLIEQQRTIVDWLKSHARAVYKHLLDNERLIGRLSDHGTWYSYKESRATIYLEVVAQAEGNPTTIDISFEALETRIEIYDGASNSGTSTALRRSLASGLATEGLDPAESIRPSHGPRSRLATSRSTHAPADETAEWAAREALGILDIWNIG